MKIAVITSSRADYGLLKPLIKRLVDDKFFDTRIIVTGTHLSSEFGNTYKEILEDNFKIYSKISILQKTDTPISITKTCSIAIEKFGEQYKKLKPDAILVLGDRYEILCSVFSAVFFKIPVIHYSGGEKTEGAYDDAIRHAITKMSHLHFVSCNEYKQRVIQLGENPRTVFNVGSLGVDNIKNIALLSKAQFEYSIKSKIEDATFLVSYYPETLSSLTAGKQFIEVLSALDKFKNCKIIFTKSNADNDGRVISKMITKYVRKNKNCVAFESLGLVRYLSAIKYCSLVIGNSSSGLTEVPSFNKPTVNIGHRQKGRVLSKSVINCKVDRKDIEETIRKAISPAFTKTLKNHKSPFGNGNASLLIVKIIKKFNINLSVKKTFNDINFKVK